MTTAMTDPARSLLLSHPTSGPGTKLGAWAKLRPSRGQSGQSETMTVTDFRQHRFEQFLTMWSVDLV